MQKKTSYFPNESGKLEVEKNRGSHENTVIPKQELNSFHLCGQATKLERCYVHLLHKSPKWKRTSARVGQGPLPGCEGGRQ